MGAHDSLEKGTKPASDIPQRLPARGTFPVDAPCHSQARCEQRLIGELTYSLFLAALLEADNA
jgi:hypothetical protein